MKKPKRQKQPTQPGPAGTSTAGNNRPNNTRRLHAAYDVLIAGSAILFSAT